MRSVPRAKSCEWVFCMVATLACIAASGRSADDDMFPIQGATLRSTLDELSPERSGDFTLMTTKIEIVRTDVDPWQALTEEELRSSGAASDATYAIATLVVCTSKVDLQRFHGEKRNWYILVDDKLVAWDHHFHGSRCVVGNHFRPASGDLVETERRFLAKIGRGFPPSMTHDLELYRKGMRYLAADRLNDAEAMLAKADLELDVGYRGIVRPDANRRLNLARDRDRDAGRQRLVDAIAVAQERQERGLPLVAAPPADEVAAMRRALGRLNQDPTAEDRRRMVEDASARDLAAAERWEREKDQRLFLEVDGGWMLVDAHKRRRGPREGETFVSFDEMMRIKAARSDP